MPKYTSDPNAPAGWIYRPDGVTASEHWATLFAISAEAQAGGGGGGSTPPPVGPPPVTAFSVAPDEPNSEIDLSFKFPTDTSVKDVYIYRATASGVAETTSTLLHHYGTGPSGGFVHGSTKAIGDDGSGELLPAPQRGVTYFYVVVTESAAGRTRSEEKSAALAPA